MKYKKVFEFIKNNDLKSYLGTNITAIYIVQYIYYVYMYYIYSTVYTNYYIKYGPTCSLHQQYQLNGRRQV